MRRCTEGKWLSEAFGWDCCELEHRWHANPTEQECREASVVVQKRGKCPLPLSIATGNDADLAQLPLPDPGDCTNLLP